MNKILPIILVGMIVSGCTNTKELYIKTMKQKAAAREDCRQKNSTMTGYVKCFHIFKRNRGFQLLEVSAITVQEHVEFEALRNLEEKYWMVLAREVDEGRANKVDAELEMTKIGQGLRDVFQVKLANQREEARRNFEQSLRFLDIYSKAIQRMTPQPQIIIPPRY